MGANLSGPFRDEQVTIPRRLVKGESTKWLRLEIISLSLLLGLQIVEW